MFVKTYFTKLLNSDLISPHTTLVDAIFRIFLANGNAPMSPIELAQISGRAPDLILRVLMGEQIYRGLRPLLEG